MEHKWNVLIGVHAVAATLSLVLGAINLLRTRRGDRIHRALGRTWLGLMYFVAFSSFWIQQIRPGNFSWIHALSAFTIVTLSLGWWFARRGNKAAHAGNMIGTYLGLWGAFIGVVAVPSRLVPEAFRDDWAAMSLLTLAVIVAGLAVVALIIRLLREEPAVRNAPTV